MGWRNDTFKAVIAIIVKTFSKFIVQFIFLYEIMYEFYMVFLWASNLLVFPIRIFKNPYKDYSTDHDQQGAMYP